MIYNVSYYWILGENVSYEKKLQFDTAAEIWRIEKYLQDLKKFQEVIDPKQKGISPGDRALKRSSGRSRKEPVTVIE